MSLPTQPEELLAYLSIGAVVDAVRPSHPDVTHSSLRFLERIGLIEPHRTRGGHRLYSPEDVERILQIKRWQTQHLSLEQIGARLRTREHLAAPGELARHVTHHLLSGDLVSARTALLEADDAGLPLARMFDGVIRPALVEVGRQWQEGTLLLAQEREISEFARDLVVSLADRHRHPHPTGPTLLASGVEGEFHELGLRMVVGMLRAEGIIVRYLGANVGPMFLAEAVNVHRPAAVLLSARLTVNLHALRASIQATRTVLAPDVPPRVIVGGEIVRHHLDVIHSWGAITIDDDDLDDVVASIRSLVTPNSGSAGSSVAIGQQTRQLESAAI